MDKAGLYFEEYTDDWSYTTGKKEITEDIVQGFVKLCDFSSPTYVDPNYAKQQYSGRLVPGMLVLALAEGLLLGEGLTFRRGIFLLELTPKFLKPTYADDVIHNRVTLQSKRLTKRDDRGVVICNHDVINQKGEIVLQYTSSRMIRTRAFVDGAVAV